MPKIKKNKKTIASTWVQKTIAFVIFVTYVSAVYSVINTNMVPTRYLAFIMPISAAIIILLCLANIKLNKLSRYKRAGILITSLITIIANIYVFSISNNAMSFLNNIQDQGYVYEQYSIVAMTNRHIKLSSDVKQSIGIIKTDVNIDLVKSGVRKITNADLRDYNELTSVTVALESNQTDMAVIKDSYLQLLHENYDEFYKRIEILKTFKIKTKNVTNVLKTDTTKPFIVYISGIDTYGDINTVSRSDVNILAAINPITHKVLLINTPRDYYVQLHGTTGLKDKLTHAGIYGVDMSIKTLEDLYDISINYYVKVNFSSLTKIINVLGGVDVYSDYEFKAGGNKYVVGYNQLNGDQALAFSRERYSFEAGDRTRGENQQRVIEAIINKVNNPSIIVNYQAILDSISGTFQTNIDQVSLKGIIRNQLDNMKKWEVESISVDGTGDHQYTYSMGSIPLYVMNPNSQSIDDAKVKIKQYQELINTEG